MKRLRRLFKPAGAISTTVELPDISAQDRRIIDATAGYTMTGPERRFALIESIRYLVQANVPGDFVECGVWRGGSVLTMILTLQELGLDNRDFWLYDTFEGMTAPTAEDVSRFSSPALATWTAAQNGAKRAWQQMFRPEVFSMEKVVELLHATGYPKDRLHFVRGPVEDTLPATIPAQIALLRLDTDWYASTRHELDHLYPRLASRGVLLIDDYGHWQGCRQAVDEYFSQPDIEPVLLNRIDYTARVAVKP